MAIEAPDIAAPAGTVPPAEVLAADHVERSFGDVRGSRLRGILVLTDVVAAATAWLVALTLPVGEGSVASSLPGLAAAVGVLTALTVAGLASQHLYLARVCGTRSVEIQRLGRVALFMAVVSLALSHVAGPELLLAQALIGAALLFLFLAATRGAFGMWLRARRTRGQNVRPIVIIGANGEARDLHRLLRTHPELGFEVRGVVGAPTERPHWESDASWLGDLDSAEAAIHSVGANGVLVAVSAVPPDELNALTRSLLESGTHVHLSSGLKGIDHRRLRALPFAREPIFYLEPLELSRWQYLTKRVLDFVLAAIGLVLAFPVLVLAAIAIKVEDGGPVLFKQQRIGRHGMPFTLLKLRTMVPHAEEQLGEIRSMNQRQEGPLFKLALDPRRTRVGRFLEVTSIDELPQLVNVLRGDMSLVGPRPALPSEVAQFDDELLERHSVLPGITGLWQLEARNNPSFHAYRRLDLFYVENWSVSLDLAILLSTMAMLVMLPFRR